MKCIICGQESQDSDLCFDCEFENKEESSESKLNSTNTFINKLRHCNK